MVEGTYRELVHGEDRETQLLEVRHAAFLGEWEDTPRWRQWLGWKPKRRLWDYMFDSGYEYATEIEIANLVLRERFAQYPLTDFLRRIG